MKSSTGFEFVSVNAIQLDLDTQSGWLWPGIALDWLRFMFCRNYQSQHIDHIFAQSPEPGQSGVNATSKSDTCSSVVIH